jgi:hypothetical protein
MIASLSTVNSRRQNVMLFAVIRKAVYRRISRWESEVYMEVRKAREWPRSLVFGVVLVVLAALSSVRVTSAAETRKTFEDRFAEQDIRDAAQDVERMHRILGAELQRPTTPTIRSFSMIQRRPK